MRKVYSVVAVCWLYEDSCECRVVATYPEQEMAELHATKANAGIPFRRLSGEEWESFAHSFPYDYLTCQNGTYITYHIRESEFVVHLDEYLERVGK